MFSIELKVNGTLVGHIYGRRIEEHGDRRKWEYEYYEPEAGELEKHTISGDKDMPLVVLVRNILDQVIR
jgi:hypothetical protein